VAAPLAVPDLAFDSVEVLVRGGRLTAEIVCTGGDLGRPFLA
jgi:hypothetical protein